MGAREGDGEAWLSSRESAADTGWLSRELPCPSSKPSLRGTWLKAWVMPSMTARYCSLLTMATE
ncbi:hypothetical protein D3C76_1817210 [compost metagenome]